MYRARAGISMNSQSRNASGADTSVRRIVLVLERLVNCALDVVNASLDSVCGEKL